ncbi:MAG: response regulator transcription factor [Pseudomonadota bacterium]
MPKTIFIADDHPLAADGLARAISSHCNLEVVAQAANGIDAIAGIKLHKPDCAVLDLSMPGANGLEVLSEAKRWSPSTRFIIVTGMPSPAIFTQLIAASVDGIFMKNSPPREICEGIEKVLSGRQIISEDVSRLLEFSEKAKELTGREIEVLQSIARGNSNKKIAEQLGVSPKTVDSHRTSLMRKLGVHSTATLLVQAMKEGLIDV